MSSATARGQDDSEQSDKLAAMESIVGRMNGFLYRGKKERDSATMLFMAGAVAELTGYPAHDLINNRRRSYGSLIHDEDSPQVEMAIDKGIREREPWSVDYRIRTARRGVRWVNERGEAIFDDNAEVLYIEGVVFDIGERLEEARRRKRMERVGEIGQQIGKSSRSILKTLKKLRILSLNASVEAARIGETGRGFGVVADEVKKLADESGKAAGSISDLMEELETELRAARGEGGEAQHDEGGGGGRAPLTGHD